MAARVTFAVAFAAVSSAHSFAQAPQRTPEPATVALVETWADGRTNYELVTTRPGKFWTPKFTTVENYRPVEGAPRVFAVQIERVLEGSNIRAKVSLLFRSAMEKETIVDDVLVTPTSHIVVEGLRKFGVAPITLSMTTVAPMTPYLPTVVSVTPLIEIADVELLSAPYPGYRLTLRNLGDRAVSNVDVQSFRGEDKALSSLQRDPSGRPMMIPGGTYTFEISLTSGGANPATTPGTWSPRPLDVIELKAVRWDDGSSSGQPSFPQLGPAIEGDAGARVQLTRITEVFREAQRTPGDRIGFLKERINALVDSEPDQLQETQRAMKAVKATVLVDIARFEWTLAHTAGTPKVLDWINHSLERYDSWRSRLAPK